MHPSFTILRCTALAAALMQLTACGGGGGGGSQASAFDVSLEVSPDNSQGVAAEVSNNALRVSASVSDAVGIASVVAEPLPGVNAPPPFGLTDVLKQLPDWRGSARPQATGAVGVVHTDNVACPLGGSYTASLNDLNNNEDWDVGEIGTATFSNCVIASGLTVNGQFKDTYLASTATTESNRFEFTNFTTASGAYTLQILGGTMTLEALETGSYLNNTYVSTDSLTLGNLRVKVTAPVDGIPVSRQFTANQSLVIDSRQPNLSRQTFTGNGNVTGSNSGFNGGVSYAITTPIVKESQSPVFYGGVMIVTGKNGSELDISYGVPDSNSVTVQARKNGELAGTPKVIAASSIL